MNIKKCGENKMIDDKLEELRKKVKEKEEMQKIEKEKARLKEKLEEGTPKDTFKKMLKKLFD